jgi:hypothetical protein
MIDPPILGKYLQRSALCIAQERDGLVLLQPVRQQIVFMDDVEQKPTFKQSKTETMDVHHGISKLHGSIEALGTLAHHHSNVGRSTLIREVVLVPVEELAPSVKRKPESDRRQ